MSAVGQVLDPTLLPEASDDSSPHPPHPRPSTHSPGWTSLTAAPCPSPPSEGALRDRSHTVCPGCSGAVAGVLSPP